MTLNVTLSILKAGCSYPNYEALFDTLTQQILDSDSPLSLVLCAYLSYKIRAELSPKTRTNKFYDAVQHLSLKLPDFSILDPFSRSDHWENNLNMLSTKFNDRLQKWEFKSQRKPFSGEGMRLYANCIPTLFDKDYDQHEAFTVFSHMVDKAHFVLFTLDALIQEVDGNCVMNLPLIQQFINADAYKAAVAELMNEISRHDVDSIVNIYSVAAYQVVLQNNTSTNSVSAEKVHTVIEEWDKQLRTQ